MENGLRPYKTEDYICQSEKEIEKETAKQNKLHFSLIEKSKSLTIEELEKVEKYSLVNNYKLERNFYYE